jgi:hypothetical protein
VLLCVIYVAAHRPVKCYTSASTAASCSNIPAHGSIADVDGGRCEASRQQGLAFALPWMLPISRATHTVPYK